MGTDNLFHKSKARKTETLRREKAKRDPYDVVLIVCEGAKTEPNYFCGLRGALRLSNANIRVADNTTGSDPLSVVDFAINEYKKDPIYDRIYCVFDKDKHVTYHQALDKIRVTRLKKATLHAITSIPCFEVWILLHFVYTTKSFCTAGNASNCDRVILELNSHISNYQKGSQHIFKTVYPKLPDALCNVKKLEAFHKTSETDNPSTKVHELVEYLMDLKK